MAQASFPGNWSKNANLTGNAQIVVDSMDTLWVVGNFSSNASSTVGDPYDAPPPGAAIYSSVDQGTTFQWIADIPDVENIVTAFDPAACIDSSNVIHFVGQVPGDGGINLQKYSYDTVHAVMTGPNQITSGATIGADYDIVPLANGHTYVVASVLTEASGLTQGLDSLLGLELDTPANAAAVLVTDNIVAPQNFTDGNRYGAISLVTPDGVDVEIYTHYHPKLVTFQNFVLTFALTVRSGSSGFGTPTVLHTTMAQHTDNRLTVLANGTERWLSECYYTLQYSSLVGNVVLGHLPTGSETWAFQEITGTPEASIVEPVLSQTASSLILAYIEQDFTVVPPADAPVRVCNLNPTTFAFSRRPDFLAPATASFLRGAKVLLPVTDIWCFLAQRVEDGAAKFFTGFNTAPAVETVASQAIPVEIVRGVPVLFDATGSYNSNYDPMVFTWSLNAETGTGLSPMIQLTADGPYATLVVPTAIGPAVGVLEVVVSVVNVDMNGNPLHAPVAQHNVVNIPAIAPPAFGESSGTTYSVARNSVNTFHFDVVPGSSVPLTYQWTQIAGTPVALSTSGVPPTLNFNTAGAAIGGETLEFAFTVEDGINTPITNVVFFTVPAATVSTTTTLNRSTFSGNIANRNLPGGTWSSVTSTGTLTAFTRMKRSTLVNGDHCACYISPEFVTVLGASNDGTRTYSQQVIDNAGYVVQDAVLTESGVVIILTTTGQLHIYALPNVPTDSPTQTIYAGAFGEGFLTLASTVSYGGSRVLALTGPSGALLLEVDNATWTVQQNFPLTVEAGMLYGADNVQWLQMTGVENLHSGEVLVGSMDGDGNYYETLIDLQRRKAIATLDIVQLQGEHQVSTGDILFQTGDPYSGAPQAPVMGSVASATGEALALSWQQTRTDLVTGYEVQRAIYLAPAFTPLPPIGSGQITTLLQTPETFPTWYRVRALSLDGTSAWSNPVVYPPLGSLVYPAPTNP